MSQLPEFYPSVDKIVEPDRNLVAPFMRGAEGATIHYTATRTFESAHKALMQSGLNYHIIIDRGGQVYQTAKLTHRVHHAGKAMWNDMSPNRTHVAVALVSWGWVESDGKNWTGRKTSMSEVAYRKGRHWHTATLAQEKALVSFCRWLVCQGIPAENICGHDECCIPAGRKMDPGGVLSLSMDQLRRLTHSAVF